LTSRAPVECDRVGEEHAQKSLVAELEIGDTLAAKPFVERRSPVVREAIERLINGKT